MLSTLYTKLCSVLDKTVTDDYDLVCTITGEKFSIRPDKRKTFYSVYESAIYNHETIPFMYHNRTSYPLSIAFNVDLADCHPANLIQLFRECNRSLKDKIRRADKEFRTIVYHTADVLVICYPLVFTIPQESNLSSERLRKSISQDIRFEKMMWHKRMIHDNSSKDYQLYSRDTHTILGCFSTNDESFIPTKRTPKELFSMYISDMMNDQLLESKDVEFRNYDDMYHVYLSSTLPRVEQLTYNEAEIIPPVINIDTDSVNERAMSDIDYDAEDFINLETLLSMWNVRRFLSVSEWMTLGEVIYNHYKGKEYGYKVWETITYKIIANMKDKGMEVPPYLLVDIADRTEVSYYLFPRGRITIETIGYVAREDSPSDYAKWHAEWCKMPFIDGISGSLLDLARAFHRYFWLDALCEPSGRGGYDWYYCDRTRHMLVRDTNCSEVCKRMMNKFRRAYRKIRFSLEAMKGGMSSYSEDEYSHEGGGKSEEDVGKILARLDILEKKLGSSFMHSIVREAGMYFSKPGMSSHFDTNADLMCVKTGVIAATRTDISFRAGRPQDYLTMETNAHFRTMSWNNPYVMKIIHWARLTFIEEDLVDYWLKFLASLIRGGNPDKVVPIIHGPKSNNGKSAWIRLITKSIGPFLRKGPMEVLTQPNRNPHGPTSLLSDWSKARLVICDEAESGGKPILAGPLKAMSGSDEYYSRRNFKEGEQITPLFLLGIVTNSIPEMSVNDDAMRERLVIIVLDTMFLPEDRCPKTEIERFEKRIFVADRFFDEHIKEMGNALLWIQYEVYPDYLNGGLDAKPQAIRDNSEKYWRDKDMWYQFESDKIDKTQNETDTMTVAEVQDVFGEWFEGAYPKRAPPTRPKLVEELTRRWNAPVDGKWAFIKRKRVFNPDAPQDERCGTQVGGMDFGSPFGNYIGYIGVQ